MPLAPGLASIVGAYITAADLALDVVEGQRRAVGLDDAADRLQFGATRQDAAQGLECDAAAPALHQAGAERFGSVMTCGADRQRKGRRQRQRIEADLALDCFFIVERQRHAPAQPRAFDAAVEIVKGPSVPGDRQARGDADILCELVRRAEIEQRREIDATDPQVQAGLRLLRPWFGGALRLGVEASSQYFRLQPQRRAPGAIGRTFELR